MCIKCVHLTQVTKCRANVIDNLHTLAIFNNQRSFKSPQKLMLALNNTLQPVTQTVKRGPNTYGTSMVFVRKNPPKIRRFCLKFLGLC